MQLWERIKQSKNIDEKRRPQITSTCCGLVCDVSSWVNCSCLRYSQTSFSRWRVLVHHSNAVDMSARLIIDRPYLMIEFVVDQCTAAGSSLLTKFIRSDNSRTTSVTCSIYASRPKQKAPLPRRAQSVRRELRYFMTFIGKKSVDGYQPILRNWPQKIPNSAK